MGRATRGPPAAPFAIFHKRVPVSLALLDPPYGLPAIGCQRQSCLVTIFSLASRENAMKWIGISLLAMSAAWLLPATPADGQDKQAKKPSDADLAKLLAGTWSMATEAATDAGKFKNTWIYQYKKDGTFTSEVTVTSVADGLKRKEAFAGKWKVAGGTIHTILTVVPPSIARVKVGDKGYERIIAIGDTMLKKQPLKDDGTPRGKEINLQRVLE